MTNNVRFTFSVGENYTGCFHKNRIEPQQIELVPLASYNI